MDKASSNTALKLEFFTAQEGWRTPVNLSNGTSSGQTQRTGCNIFLKKIL
tara:strand:+ start:162 stop:311 length:150 start_codon:yes stop_codon:yes gene_type:complete